MNRFVLIPVCLFMAVASQASNLAIVPSTTLAAQTSNNTSAANSFYDQSNGNLGNSNISKVDIHSLLYPGATTRVYAHLMLWFGGPDHMNVGYNSEDPAQVHRQITDMISRGIQGVVIVWYGPNNEIDRATQLVMKEAEAHPGFTFAIMIEGGAIRWYSCAGCSPQQTLVYDLQYLQQNYFSSPAYLRFNGQPVVTNFDIDLYYSVNWQAAAAAVSSRPAFLFQHSQGFSHPISQGSYSWDIAIAPNLALNYLTQFYSTAQHYPNDLTIGAAYKGFNDKFASWSLNRVMDQQCGQTWLQTFMEVNNFYNSGHQLQALQTVTWNDYEEGTEIETGIDNCLSVSASASNGSLEWSVSGNENAVDHYTVYASTDGQNLMALGNEPAGTHSLDMCSYALPPGDYQLFVQAVGKPSVKNQMSSAVSYTAQCSASQSASSTVGVSASPPSVNVGPGTAGTSSISIQLPSNVRGPVSLSCANLPAGMNCVFSPSTLAAGSSLRSALTISTGSTESAKQEKRFSRLFYGMMLSFGVPGFAFIGAIERKRAKLGACVLGLAAIVLLASSCGGGPTASAYSETPVTAGSYTVLVNASSGVNQGTTPLTVTVQ